MPSTLAIRGALLELAAVPAVKAEKGTCSQKQHTREDTPARTSVLLTSQVPPEGNLEAIGISHTILLSGCVRLTSLHPGAQTGWLVQIGPGGAPGFKGP